MSVNKKLMRKWIDALRSRKYKQGFGYLRAKGPTKDSVDRFCCLGVLCDIYNNKLWKKDNLQGVWYLQLHQNETRESTALPMEIFDKIGISSDDELYLMEMNDSQSKKFYQIANYLEKKYLS